jgi:hypothetical protein
MKQNTSESMQKTREGLMKKQMMSRLGIRALALGGLLFAQASTALANRATVAPEAIWVHDQIYGTVATVTAFKSPPAHSTDVIYSFAKSGLEGQRSVAVYAPGDPEYNGGRWDVMGVTVTEAGMAFLDIDHDGMIDEEITNAEDVEWLEGMGLVTIEEAGVYFECPLRPMRGKR